MDVEIALLGGFRVSVGGVAVPDDAWGRRSAAALVKLLALAPQRRMHREQVIDALWPGLGVADAGPRLHKAAHFARRAVGEQTSGVVLRGEIVVLLPEDDVGIDAVRFEADARAALEHGDADAAAAVASAYGRTLLPDDPYEPWVEDARERLRILRVDLLRLAGSVGGDPRGGPGRRGGPCRARSAGGTGWGRAWRAAPARAPGTRAARRARDRAGAGGRAPALRAAGSTRACGAGAGGGPEPGLVGRQAALAALSRAMVRARDGRGTTVLVTGPTGVGKSALVDAAVARAQEQDWRFGRGAASLG